MLSDANRRSQSRLQRAWGRCFFVFASCVVACVAAQSPEVVTPISMKVTMPQSVDNWTLAGPPNRIKPDSIFEYMDGAGELYRGYRLQHLDVYEYKSPEQDDILVELYWMELSDDAFGLLSGDWGGAAVDLADTAGQPAPGLPRALYGAGLLRIWSGPLYARVLSYQETDRSKQAVLALGRAIVAGRPALPAPQLVRILPQAVGAQHALRADRTVFLRSHLVLNATYFLASDNLLNLNLNCEAVTAVFRSASDGKQTKPVRVLLVRYPTADAAASALAHFAHVYLRGKTLPRAGRGAVAIEDGWTGFIASGRMLGLVFEAPDERTASDFLSAARTAAEHLETNHD
jgi:hypothetical protein